MNDIRFDGLQNVKTPENWVENAINIPKKNKSRPLPLKKIYLIAAAASVAFVVGLSVFLFLTTGQQPLPAAPTISPETTAPAFTAQDGARYVPASQGETPPVTDDDRQTLAASTNPDTADVPMTATRGSGTATAAPTTSASIAPQTEATASTTLPLTDPPEPAASEEPTDEEPVTAEPWIVEPETPTVASAPGEDEPQEYFEGTITYVDNGTFQDEEVLSVQVYGTGWEWHGNMSKTAENTFRITVSSHQQLPQGWYTIRVFSSKKSRTFYYVRLYGNITLR